MYLNGTNNICLGLAHIIVRWPLFTVLGCFAGVGLSVMHHNDTCVWNHIVKDPISGRTICVTIEPENHPFDITFKK